MEEADARLAELKKSSYEFDRDVLKPAHASRTGRVVAEKAIRYFEDRIRARDALIEKLRLKNSTLKVQKKKLNLQLKQVMRFWIKLFLTGFLQYFSEIWHGIILFLHYVESLLSALL